MENTFGKKLYEQQVLESSGAKKPPQAIDLEEVVIGALLIDTKAFEEIKDSADADHFYLVRHRHIFNAIKTLYGNNVPIDLKTVANQLKRDNKLKDAGGDFYLVDLTQKVASSAHIGFHMQIIKQKYVQRELIRQSKATIDEASKEENDVFDLLDKKEKHITKMLDLVLNGADLRIKPKEINNDIHDFLDGKIKKGYSIGVKDWDDFWSFKVKELMVMTGKKGIGKLQPFTSKVMTPTGWKTLKNVGVGDYVMCPVVGKPVKIIDEFYGNDLDIYKITFKDKTEVECCNDHLWKVQTTKDKTKNKYRVIDLNTIIKNGVRAGKGYRYSIPLTNPLEFEDKDVILNPYFLGLMLGNGYISSKNQNTLTFHEKYTPLVFDKIKNIIPTDVGMRLDKTYGDSKAQRIIFNAKIKKYFKSLDLLDKKSRAKFIPKEYLINSIDNRFKLLQGLMDSDGSCFITKNKKGYSTKRLSYSTMSEKLKDDVIELVKSLGGLVFLTKETREKYNGGTCYLLNIKIDKNPFTFGHKKENFDKLHYKTETTNAIISVDYIGKKDGKCLMLDSKDHLYITDGYTVTHNTVINQILQLMGSLSNGLKWVVSFQENAEWSVKVTYMQLLLGDFARDVYKTDHYRYVEAERWIDKHFYFVEAENVREVLDYTKGLIKRGDDIYGVMLDPINSFVSGYERTGNNFQDGVQLVLKTLQFTKKWCSVYVNQHPTMENQRKDEDVTSWDGEMGYWFNKASMAYTTNRNRSEHVTRLKIDTVRTTLTGGESTDPLNSLLIHWSPKTIGISNEEGTFYEKDIIGQLALKAGVFSNQKLNKMRADEAFDDDMPF